MPKVTIYLPDALAERVRHLGLSVSPICQSALQEEVEKLTATKHATRDLKKIAERLRDTLEPDEAESRGQGFADGTEWARQVATMTQLRRVANASRDYGRLQLPLEPFVAEYITTLWQHRFASDPRWNDWDVHSDTYLEGFTDAATTVYRNVLPLV